ncbi:MAG: YDG/SRA domain-containing protein [Homoserinimonas sp.]
MVRFFGTPDGVKVGELFESRDQLRHAKLHNQGQAGIAGTPHEGADAIVLSGGYPDDEDHGDYILYTGHGGQGPGKKQVADQDPSARGNAALATSFVRGLPVRVIRGSKLPSPYAPPVGYRYAGLYLVTSYWHQQNPDGFTLMRYTLERVSEQEPFVANVPAESDPAYASSVVIRRLRDTALSRRVKSMYSNKCQVCGSSIPGIGERLYSEGAHVKPLGTPHLGADKLDNILCLCPNHHTQLDIGGMVILDDLSVARTIDYKPFTELSFAKGHQIDVSNAKYHRRMWAPLRV